MRGMTVPLQTRKMAEASISIIIAEGAVHINTDVYIADKDSAFSVED